MRTPELPLPQAAIAAHSAAAALFARLADFDGIPDIWLAGAAGVRNIFI